MRAFIAIELEPGLKTILQKLVGELKAGGADIRWVQPGGLHLTLKFLGQIDEGQADAVKSALGEVVARNSPFDLRLEGTGAFPGRQRPRVLWIGFNAEPGLMALQEDIERALEAIGFPREERPFHPHLTLGRVKGPRGVKETLEELEKHGLESLGSMVVRRVTFFESRLHPEGATYRALAEFNLS